MSDSCGRPDGHPDFGTDCTDSCGRNWTNPDFRQPCGSGTGGTAYALGAKTNYCEQKHLEHELGIATWVMPANVYLAYFIADPTETGILANEVTGGGYERAVISFGATGTGSQVNGGYSMANISTVVFPASTGAWSSGAEVTHVGICDAATAGNVLRFAKFAVPFTVTGAGDQKSYGAGEIIVQEF